MPRQLRARRVDHDRGERIAEPRQMVSFDVVPLQFAANRGGIRPPGTIRRAGHLADQQVEQAGGGATDGHRRILDVMPERLHQRTPFVFGSHEEVARISRYKSLRDTVERSPLFNERGLFEARR